MHTTTRRLALVAASVAVVLTTAACGGGGGDASAEASANALDADRASALARRRPPPPPPPPPPPATDTTLALASATASGTAVGGETCAVSANGGKVLFTSASSKLVDPTPFEADIYLKDFNGNGVTLVVANSSRSVACLAMTPDANTVVFVDRATNGKVDTLGNSGSELAILVKSVSTGVQTRVTPLLSSLANVDHFQFAGVSDDGLRVAFIAQPTRTCSGYDCTANGPARMLVRDLASGALINLESQVRFTTSQGFADGDAWLSPNGRTLAFSSRVPYPQAGDTNPSRDIFALEIASGSVRLVNTDAAGRQITFTGSPDISANFSVQAFLSNGSRVAFFADFDTSAGPGGVFAKDLATGALTLVLNRSLTSTFGNRGPLSFSDDGRKVAYVEGSGGGTTYRELPRVVDLITGARVNAATLSNGTVGNGLTNTNVLLSRDGRTAAFSNNSTNLLGGVSPLGGAELRAYRKLLP